MLEKRQTDPKPAKFCPPAQANIIFPHNQIQTAQLGGNPICQSTSQDG